MHSHHLQLEEPIRMASILEPSKPVRIKKSNHYNYNLFSFFFVVVAPGQYMLQYISVIVSLIT